MIGFIFDFQVKRRLHSWFHSFWTQFRKIAIFHIKCNFYAVTGVLAGSNARFSNFSWGHIFGYWGAQSGSKGSGEEIFHHNGKWGGTPHKPWINKEKIIKISFLWHTPWQRGVNASRCFLLIEDFNLAFIPIISI